MFSFDLKGSRQQGVAFIEALKLFSHLANVGDCRSLVIHPASTTHFRMDDAALAAAGIGPGTIRLSIGLEDPDDLIEDLKRALKVAEKAAHEARRSTAARPTPTPAASPSMPALPCVVFVHGAMNDHGVFTLLARWFAHHGWGVLAPDLPGHMRSAGPALASVEAMADWLLALLDAAGVEQAALAGHSLGSLVALEAAARAPERVDAPGDARHRRADAGAGGAARPGQDRRAGRDRPRGDVLVLDPGGQALVPRARACGCAAARVR